MKCFGRVVVGSLVLIRLVFCCSWDYPIWQKSKQSDVALFRFVVKEKDGTGYIDRTGKVAIQPNLRSFGNSNFDDFFDGLAGVRIGTEDWFVDATGKRVFTQQIPYGAHFAEGLAVAMNHGKIGFVDRQGTFAIAPTFDSAGFFSDGLAAVKVGQLLGFVGKDGSIEIAPKYFYAADFHEGAARVIEEGQCLYVGYMPCDFYNPVVLPYNPDVRQPANVPKCRYSFVNRRGTRLFDTRYPDAKDFSQGLAPVGDGKLWGYVDYRGRIMIPFRYDDAEPFSEGLARVKTNGKWGYIDRDGRMVIPAIYLVANDFSEGLAVVGSTYSTNWYIDAKGRQAIPGLFEAASAFVMGLAHVRVGQDYYQAKWSYIDHNGRAIFTYSDQSGQGTKR